MGIFVSINQFIMRYFLVLLITILSFSSSAQTIEEEKEPEKFIQLTGIIISDSLFRVPFATVSDISTKRGVVADYYGYFAIVVHPGDTLVFSSLGYKRKLYVVDDTTSMNYSLVQVMTYDTIVADPVEVYPWPSKEDLDDYIVNMDVDDDAITRARERLTPQEMAFVGALMASDGYSSYSASQQQYLQEQYTRGQGAQNNLLNPSSWAQFLNGIGTGKYRISQ